MANVGPMLECVAFMLMRDGRVLLERRSLTRRLLPGALAIPGGPEEALVSAEGEGSTSVDD